MLLQTYTVQILQIIGGSTPAGTDHDRIGLICDHVGRIECLYVYLKSISKRSNSVVVHVAAIVRAFKTESG